MLFDHGGSLEALIRKPMFWESLLWLVLALCSETAQPMNAGGLGFVFAGLSLRIWFFRNIRPGRQHSPWVAHLLFRHPFETGGLLIVCGLGLISANLVVFAPCFLVAALLSFRLINMHMRSLGAGGDLWLIRSRFAIPAISPAAPAPDQDLAEHLSRLNRSFRSFYDVRPSRQSVLLLLSLLIIWLKGLAQFDFWTVF